MTTAIGPVRAQRLMKYEGLGALTQADLNDIIVTLWPKAPPTEVKKAMLICFQYRLNPLMKHVYLLPFKSKKDDGTVTWAMALGIRATRTLAARQRRFVYLDNTPRIMTPEEQITIFGAVDKSNIVAITKLRDISGGEAQGYGTWPKGVSAYGAEKGNSQSNMAFIRSERAALDRLCPDAAPESVTETVDEQYAEIPQVEDPRGDNVTASVDPETGEIVEIEQGRTYENPSDGVPGSSGVTVREHPTPVESARPEVVAPAGTPPPFQSPAPAAAQAAAPGKPLLPLPEGVVDRATLNEVLLSHGLMLPDVQVAAMAKKITLNSVAEIWDYAQGIAKWKI